MNPVRRPEPIRFIRGRSLYQIARAHGGEEGYIGIVDGRVVARGPERAAIARALIGRAAGGPSPAA